MILLALLLIVEGMSTGLWIARLVPWISRFGAVLIVLMVIRGLVGAMQLAGGVFLIGRRPAAVTLAQWALLGSATMTTLEIGLRLVPNGLAPDLRWPLVGGYWVYALAATVYLGSRGERQVQVEKSREVQVEKDQEVQGDKDREVQQDKGPGSTGE